ncbi:M16 family metallopeptidase, partial [Anoxybacillus sp.]
MIKTYTCQNGVRVVLEHIPTVRSVAIGIWIGTGSRNENEQNNGISHFLEHMFFKGTKTRSARDIAESFDRIGGQVNAFTSKEYTCYYAKVLDTHASFALDILADMFFHSTFVDDELQKEKNVVFEEIKMYEDTPDDLVHDLLSKASYGNHPLGYPILGTEQTLATFTG